MIGQHKEIEIHVQRECTTSVLAPQLPGHASSSDRPSARQLGNRHRLWLLYDITGCPLENRRLWCRPVKVKRGIAVTTNKVPSLNVVMRMWRMMIVDVASLDESGASYQKTGPSCGRSRLHSLLLRRNTASSTVRHASRHAAAAYSARS
jgi:hypothetical protein